MFSVKYIAFGCLALITTETMAHADPFLTLTAKQLSPFQGYFTLQDAQIEIDAQIAKVPAGFSFGGVAFDITLSTQFGGVLTHPTTPAYLWRANNPFWTNDAGDIQQQVFQTAGDRGVSSTDLQSIVVVVSRDTSVDLTGGNFGTDAADPCLAILQGAPFKLGTFKVQWDAQGLVPLPPLEPGDHTILNPYTIGFANIQFDLIDDSTAQFGPTITSAADISATPFQLTDTPEPASLLLLSLASLPVLARRRSR